MEAMRALKRRLSDIVYRAMVNDALRPAATTTAEHKTGPGGHSGATLKSSAASPTPAADSSDKSLPGPATGKPTTPLKTAS
jgi:transposase